MHMDKFLDIDLHDCSVLTLASLRQCDMHGRGFLGSSLLESESRKRRAGAGTAFSIMEPQYSEMDRQAADKKARRYNPTCSP